MQAKTLHINVTKVTPCILKQNESNKCLVGKVLHINSLAGKVLHINSLVGKALHILHSVTVLFSLSSFKWVNRFVHHIIEIPKCST